MKHVVKPRTFQLGPRRYGPDADMGLVVLASSRRPHWVRPSERGSGFWTQIARAGLWVHRFSFVIWDEEFGGQFQIQILGINIHVSW